MINLANFIESNIFIVICVGVILISGLIVIVHVSAKNKEKRRRKQNTKELNDTLTMEILDEQNSPVVILPERREKLVEESVTKKEEPVIVIDKNENDMVDIVEEISTELEKKKENVELQAKEESANIIDEEIQEVEMPQIETNKEEVKENKIEIEEKEEIKPVYEMNKEEDLVYAPIELNKEEAREVLDRLAVELAEKEEKKELENIEEDEKNIELTNFEKEQEENAIISLDELMERGKELYNQNEVVRYDDEGDEPITIEQLQERWQKEKEAINQIEIEEKLEEIESVKEEQTFVESIENEEIVNNTTVIVPEKTEELYQKEVKKVEFPSILPNRKEAYESKFENSPIISPIYGIERKKFEEQERLHPELVQAGNLEFENTANYEKFDEEIKKTNEFIAALKELQKKLD